MIEISLLEMKYQLTPEGHEDGEEDGGVVVEEVGHLGQEARVRELPIITEVITNGTHRQVTNTLLVANFETKKITD